DAYERRYDDPRVIFKTIADPADPDIAKEDTREQQATLIEQHDPRLLIHLHTGFNDFGPGK
ncbi:MAG: hypothetical protein ABIH34_02310, partial [Nanoarchaeota archaeon]